VYIFSWESRCGKTFTSAFTIGEEEGMINYMWSIIDSFEYKSGSLTTLDRIN